MDFNSLPRHEQLAGVAAVIAVVSLFLPWYGEGEASASAFDSGFLAWAGMLLALAGAVVLLLKAFEIHNTELGGMSAEYLALSLASLGTIFVLLRLTTGGPSGGGVRFGLVIGLITSAAIAYGCFCSRDTDGGTD